MVHKAEAEAEEDGRQVYCGTMRLDAFALTDAHKSFGSREFSVLVLELAPQT